MNNSAIIRPIGTAPAKNEMNSRPKMSQIDTRNIKLQG